MIKENVSPGMVALDIGAFIGFYTLALSKIVGGNGKVYAFEPGSANFLHLKANTAKKTNVTIANYAVGEKQSKVPLYISSDLGFDHQCFDIGEGRERVEVNCIAIDDYLNNNERIDFVKIDIEGYDYYAVKGMQKTIKRSGRVFMCGELWPYALKRTNTSVAAYIGLLHDLGFKVTINCKKDIKEFQSSNDKLFMANFFALKEK